MSLLWIQKKIKEFKAEYLICENATIKNVKQEFLKRFYKPIYFPLLALISCLLILKSKESNIYNKFKLYIFLITFLILIVSEISLRYATSNNMGILFFIAFPILSFFTIYFPLMLKFNKKV